VVRCRAVGHHPDPGPPDHPAEGGRGPGHHHRSPNADQAQDEHQHKSTTDRKEQD
jgi:hypothetical protein